MEKNFKGIFAALTTPFVDGKISPEKLRENIQKFNRTGLAGYVVMGSTGEAPFVDDEEAEILVREARKAASPEKHIIAGTGRDSAEWTIKLTNRLAESGAQAALIKPPYYYKSRMNYAALKAYYSEVADRAKIPVIIYNIPQNTQIWIPLELAVELSNHQNIIGLKESGGSLAYLSEVCSKVPADFQYLTGSGSILYSALEMGASGAILALANVAPELCVKLYELFVAGKKEEARQLQYRLIPLNRALTETHGIPAIKYALDRRGFYGGPCRTPLLPLETNAQSEIATYLRDLNLLS
ncbi:MAG: dihydrodipicolinate synthase family protein [Candidatus Saccharicenans sp.]|uniref:dihydrodipicolinate synthase family protein n=1 Tax=Candidatus Saccharicenans sp. TaxID=2819258 RepID=UPI004049AB1F